MQNLNHSQNIVAIRYTWYTYIGVSTKNCEGGKIHWGAYPLTTLHVALNPCTPTNNQNVFGENLLGLPARLKNLICFYMQYTCFKLSQRITEEFCLKVALHGNQINQYYTIYNPNDHTPVIKQCMCTHHVMAAVFNVEQKSCKSLK